MTVETSIKPVSQTVGFFLSLSICLLTENAYWIIVLELPIIVTRALLILLICHIISLTERPCYDTIKWIMKYQDICEKQCTLFCFSPRRTLSFVQHCLPNELTKSKTVWRIKSVKTWTEFCREGRFQTERHFRVMTWWRRFDSGDDDAYVNDGKPPPLIRGKSEKMATGEFWSSALRNRRQRETKPIDRFGEKDRTEKDRKNPTKWDRT